MNFKIDPEFKQLLTPLSATERAQLEANLVAEGCRDPLVVWHDVLLDGHNRYEICSRLGLGYEVSVIDLANRESAINWIIDNQLGKRNVTPEQASYLRGKKYNREKSKQGGTGANQHTIEQKDQNDPSAKTADRLAEQFKVSAPTIKRDARFAEAVDAVAANVGDEARKAILTRDAPFTKQAVIELASQPAEKQRETFSKPHVSHNSGNYEWYTPEIYIEAARRVMGAIDLDPASSEVANRIVKAEIFYTIDDDGLSKEWAGKVWLNPPYASDLVGRFVNKLKESRDVDVAIVLVNNATDTAWFRTLIDMSSIVMFTTGRIKYLNVDGEVANSPIQGQAIALVGGQGEFDDAFVAEFRKFGWCAGLIRW